MKWTAVAVAVMTVVGCSTSSTPAASPAPAQKSTFADNLSLTVALGSPLTAGDALVTAKFVLKNNGAAEFDGCFGPAWGLSVVGEDGHNAGYTVRADYPRCEEKFKLLPRQEIVWSKPVTLTRLRAGTAKVTGWVRIVDPATCKPQAGCRDVSVATGLMRVSVAAK